MRRYTMGVAALFALLPTAHAGTPAEVAPATPKPALAPAPVEQVVVFADRAG